jgi:hypothetical protein
LSAAISNSSVLSDSNDVINGTDLEIEYQNFKNDEDSSSRKQSNIYTGESKIGKGTKYLGKTKS